MREITVKVHAIAEDGLPDVNADRGRIAFLFDGNVVSGWPVNDLDASGEAYWEANSDVGNNRLFGCVTHWIEFPVPIRDLEKE